MGYRAVDAAELAAAPGPHPAASAYDKGVGAALGVQRFGIYQVELPPGAETVAHDHAEDGAEDVYAVIRGSGSVLVDDEEVPVRPGLGPGPLTDVSGAPRGGLVGGACSPHGVTSCPAFRRRPSEPCPSPGPRQRQPRW